VKIAVSLPDELFDEAEQAAARLGLNRSQFYAQAIRLRLRELGPDPVTAKLDELADATASGLGASAARRLIDQGAWEW
jgi:metal-responsive CopG/Arc/MetJ family transcriptional regulator